VHTAAQPSHDRAAAIPFDDFDTNAVDKAREGDHICYYSDLGKIMSDYPRWRPRVSVAETFDQLVESVGRRKGADQ
jgi:hypothetical protein